MLTIRFAVALTMTLGPLITLVGCDDPSTSNTPNKTTPPKQATQPPRPAFILARDGIVQRIHVQPNQKVEARKILFVLSNPILTQELNAATLKVKQTEAVHNDLSVRLNQERSLLQASLAKIEHDLNQARLQAASDKQRSIDGLVPPINAKRSALAANQMQARFDKESKRYEKMLVSHAAQLKTTATAVTLAKEQHALSQAKVDQLTLRSPIAGIAGDHQVKVGQTVKAFDELLQINPLPVESP